MRRPTKGWSCPITPGNKFRAGWCCLVALLAAGGPALADSGVTEVEAVLPISPPRQGLPVGERLSCHLRWFGIPVGLGWIELKAPADLHGRSAYLIEAYGTSNEFLSKFYPIRDHLKSYLAADTLQPLQFEKSQQEGHYRSEEIVTFDYATHTAAYRSLINERSVKQIDHIPDDVQDLLSALYWLRRQPVVIGRPLSVPIYTDEKVYHTRIDPLKTLQLELLWRGTFPCIMLEPTASFQGIFVRRGRIWAYLSADERRLPLFIKITTPWGPMTGVIDPGSLAAALAVEAR